MKRTGLMLTTFFIFILSLYVAYQQGYAGQIFSDASALSLSLTGSEVSFSYFQEAFLSLFSSILSTLNFAFAGNILVSVLALALIVELVTLYPAVALQLKQKKIHLFHKKLVDRFKSGEFNMSKTKRELNLLYAVNEKMHRRGALLVAFQGAAFIFVLAGLYLFSKNPTYLTGSFNALTFSLMAKPAGMILPLMTALTYVFYALIKIHIKQKEDYVSQTQVKIALGFTVLASISIFFLSGMFSTLLSVYLIAQFTFATLRFLMVEEKSKAWSKLAQRELIKMLQTAEIHKNKWEHASRKFNHLAPVRHLNLHLLEEGLSMSLALLVALTFVF